MDGEESGGLSEYDQAVNDAAAAAPSKRIRSSAEVIDAMASDRYAKASDKQRRTAQEFYEVVEAWANGNLSLDQADELSGDGWLRAMCLSITPSTHPQYKNAMRLLDLLIERQGNETRFKTKNGWFTQQDIDDHNGRRFKEVVEGTGEIREVIQFPVGINPNTGERIWPNRTERLVEDHFTAYVSPYRADWYDETE